jgi:hypothetical protein
MQVRRQRRAPRGAARGSGRDRADCRHADRWACTGQGRERVRARERESRHFTVRGRAGWSIWVVAA